MKMFLVAMMFLVATIITTIIILVAMILPMKGARMDRPTMATMGLLVAVVIEDEFMCFSYKVIYYKKELHIHFYVSTTRPIGFPCISYGSLWSEVDVRV